ncbi:MAG: GNAT family N-acetyltransferase [Pseudonocardiales bacterium]|nr:GNAT family N-acetyltransferase [Pseudonocardiales bacterium]
MTDIVVPLYSLPSPARHLEKLQARSIVIRRILPPEAPLVLRWVDEHFANQYWNGETGVAVSRTPNTCFIAVDEGKMIVGFLCFEVTFRGFIGPGGVAAPYRRNGIFTALMLRTCEAMRELGYAYAIVGDVAEITAILLRGLGGIAAPFSEREKGPYSALLPCADQSTPSASRFQ